MGKSKKRKKNNKDISMMTAKGFMQMFTVGGVGSGGFSHSLDVHADTHTPIHNTDYGRQSEARNESVREDRVTTHFDKDQTMHIYDRGSELAHNGNDRSGSSGDTSPYDNNG